MEVLLTVFWNMKIIIIIDFFLKKCVGNLLNNSCNIFLQNN